MSDAYVDTDVIVRFITGDDPAKAAVATRLFTQVEQGNQTLYCPVTAIADSVNVLTSRKLYGLDRRLVATALGALLDLSHFRVRQKATVGRALTLFAQTNLDFGDAVLLAEMADVGLATVFSYDRDFDDTPGVRRQEPP